MRIYRFKKESLKEAEARSGFVAMFLVIGSMVLMSLSSLGASSAALGYLDSADRREYRMVAGQNAKSCVSVALLAFAHDYFYSAQDQSVPDFSCTIVSAKRSGASVFVVTSSSIGGVTESVSAIAQDTGESIELVQYSAL
ncbi:MAG: hypothetical protein P4L61_04305 [Candidatus Pacebacteria bacterium]|nr:hypothetical protein [Candidatus Paceibacterota bacterium]